MTAPGTMSREGGIERTGIENVAFDERAPAHELGVAAGNENGFHAVPV